MSGPSPKPKISDFEKRLAAKERFIPETGANLVGLDDYEDPGDELYLIGHFETKAEAEAALQARKDDPLSNGDPMFIYEPG